MANQQEAGAGSGLDDPDQEQASGEEAAAVEGGGSWYWTNMLNFSQSGSSSTHTSAGGHVAGSQFTAGSPPSSSSVHNNNNNTLQFNTNNEQVDHAATPLDSMLPSSNNPASNNDPENAVWSQDFLSGPICESKSGMAACSGDDGLQELLYPRSVRELLLDVQSSSWDLLQQAAINKSFGFPLGPDDPHLHGLVPNPDVKPAHGVQAGLHFSHDDRLSCSTASSTLSENALAEPHWPATQQAALTDHASHATCAMHVPHTTFALHQFDHTRVKQEYSPQPSATSAPAFAKAGAINPFLLQHQQQQQNLRLIHPAHDMQANEAAAMANVNADIKPAKQQLQPWPSSPAAAGPHLCRTSSAIFQAPSPAAALDHRHHFLLNSLKQHQLLDSGSFTRAMSPSFFQDVDQAHHHLLQQSGLQPHLYRQAADNGALSNHPAQYLDQGGGFKKSRAHLEIGHPVKELKGVATSADDFSFKRPKIEPQQQPASASLKSQPVRKEKLGDRITTLQQLVSPYGKTDTASVLLEAIGYIKFLQEQVQTLSKPYLKSASNSITQCGDKNQNGDDSKPDLRSKGLCLVPLSCTMQVANDNGADYWYGGAFK